MAERTDHTSCVDAWLAIAGRDRSPDRGLKVLEDGLAALCACTRTTLGEVTLAAIVERVLHNAGERFPLLASINVAPDGGVQFDGLRERTSSLDDPNLQEGMRFVLVELLTVLGNLTAEILTPDLHAALLHVGREVRTHDEDRKP